MMIQLLHWGLKTQQVNPRSKHYNQTWRLEQHGRHYAADIFKGIFFTEKFCILTKISLKFVSKGPIDNNQYQFR